MIIFQAMLDVLMFSGTVGAFLLVGALVLSPLFLGFYLIVDEGGDLRPVCAGIIILVLWLFCVATAGRVAYLYNQPVQAENVEEIV